MPSFNSIISNCYTKRYHHHGEEGCDRPLRFESKCSLELLNRIGIDELPRGISEHALRCILAEGIKWRNHDSWVSYTLNSNKYPSLRRYFGPECTLKNVKATTEYTNSIGAIEIDKGKSWANGGKGKQSRFRANHLLCSAAEHCLPSTRTSYEIIRLKDSSRNLIRYDDDDRTRKLRHELQEWNEQIADFRVWINDSRVKWTDDRCIRIESPRSDSRYFYINPDATQMYRVFNNGSFALGGRAFGVFWQSLPKTYRRGIMIDDSPTSSADYSCSHLRLAYAEAGLEPGMEDAYSILGYESNDERNVVKAAVNIALNCNKGRVSATRAIANEITDFNNPGQGPVKGNEDYRQAEGLLDALLARHDRIRGAFFTGSGLRFSATEAVILNEVAKGARSHGIVTLPVHDEMIVPAADVQKVKELMIEKWSNNVSVCPIVK